MIKMVTFNRGRKLLFPRRRRVIPFIIIRNVKMSGEPDLSKPIENAIREKLESNLNPIHLNITNESYMHSVRPNSETHFRITVVSPKFENIPLLERHRMIHEVLKHELDNGIHALSITARTPTQWAENYETVSSPRCLGGKK